MTPFEILPISTEDAELAKACRACSHPSPQKSEPEQIWPTATSGLHARNAVAHCTAIVSHCPRCAAQGLALHIITAVGENADHALEEIEAIPADEERCFLLTAEGAASNVVTIVREWDAREWVVHQTSFFMPHPKPGAPTHDIAAQCLRAVEGVILQTWDKRFATPTENAAVGGGLMPGADEVPRIIRDVEPPRTAWRAPPASGVRTIRQAERPQGLFASLILYGVFGGLALFWCVTAGIFALSFARSEDAPQPTAATLRRSVVKQAAPNPRPRMAIDVTPDEPRAFRAEPERRPRAKPQRKRAAKPWIDPALKYR